MNSKGFTLIELLVVIIVVGVLAAIAWPSYRLWVRRAQEVEVLALFDQLEPELWQYRLENGEWPPDEFALEKPDGVDDALWRRHVLDGQVDYEHWSNGEFCMVHLSWLGRNRVRDHAIHESLGTPGLIATPGDDKVKILHLYECDLPQGAVQ